jgi:hypothetical protein
MSNSNGTAVNQNERMEESMKHEKPQKDCRKPFNPIRNVEKLLLTKNKFRASGANNPKINN